MQVYSSLAVIESATCVHAELRLTGMRYLDAAFLRRVQGNRL